MVPLSLLFSALALNACARTSAGEVEVVEAPLVHAEVSIEVEPSPHEVLRGVAEDLGTKEVERMAREEPEKLAELGFRWD